MDLLDLGAGNCICPHVVSCSTRLLCESLTYVVVCVCVFLRALFVLCMLCLVVVALVLAVAGDGAVVVIVVFFVWLTFDLYMRDVCACYV